jgi:hypothetical protein
MEKIELNPETFENVRRMLASPDEANVITGLMALEQIDFRSSKMYLVMLYKENTERKGLWQVNCPNLVKNIENLGLDNEMSFVSIYDKLFEDVTPDEEAVYFERFGAMAAVMLKGWGFAKMIDDLDIVIKRKSK